MQGHEWVVEAYGCDALRLADLHTMRHLFDALVHDLTLNPVASVQWHVFPPPGGITGVLMLAESHLTVHTFPEHASLCLNLFCCTPRAPWAWDARLGELVGAQSVQLRTLVRDYGGAVKAVQT